MKVAELVKISEEILKLLSKHAIRTDDYKYVDLFNDYLKMKEKGDKTSYVVAVLSEKYKIGEASVYRLLRRFRETIKS